jgi:hypothetical protein
MSAQTIVRLFVIPIAVWLGAGILDPVRTARFEARYWWRFPPGTALPVWLDSDLLANSRSLRTKGRMRSAFLLVALVALLAVIGVIRFR